MCPETEPKIEFKRVQHSELSTLSDWIKRYYTYDHIEFDEAKVRKGLETLLQSDAHGVSYFVNWKGQTIGYFILTYAFDIEFGGLHGMLTDLFFSEDARRSGAGTTTFQFIESLCRKQNFSVLLLQVEHDNHKAQAFYQKSGLKTLTRHLLTKNLEQKNS